MNFGENRASLDFLGYTFRWHPLWAAAGLPARRAVEEGKKALKRERGRICALTDRRQGCSPIPQLIRRLNRQVAGWAEFSWGYPRAAYRDINLHLGYRLANHLRHHRSQRPYQLPEVMSLYEHLQRLGLHFLSVPPPDAPASP